MRDLRFEAPREILLGAGARRGVGGRSNQPCCRRRFALDMAKNVNSIDLIGWSSSVVLLATIGRQVYTQWKTRSAEGVSRWLFVGQVTASTGYAIYSVLLHNWVFMTSNIALLGTAVVGQALFLRNRRLQAARQDTTT
jgi:MtN3 and saliva related transmembrane protein